MISAAENIKEIESMLAIMKLRYRFNHLLKTKCKQIGRDKAPIRAMIANMIQVP